VNPPYTEDLINRTIGKVLSELNANGSTKSVSKVVYIILPNWQDLKSIQKLLASPMLLHSIVIKPGEMYFEMQNQEAYIVRSENLYVVLYNKIGQDQEYDKQLIAGLLAIKKYKPKTASTRILGSVFSNTMLYI